jgi:L-seryl-tRNA(Ser) seleniumtransferase
VDVRPAPSLSDRSDRFGNTFADDLPYARGRVLRGTADDSTKLRRAWRLVERHHRAGRLYNFTGLERSLVLGDAEPQLLDDDLAPAFYGQRLEELALQHLGGVPGRDDILLANRLTAAIFVAMQSLVTPGTTVLGISAGYSHPGVVRAVHAAGGRFVDTGGLEQLRERLRGEANSSLVVLTRLAVTYEPLPSEELEGIVASAHEHGALVFADDAGGARVGPAVLGQPKTLELGVDVGATGLDKYGTTGPRLGLLGGRRELVAPMRARALELGMEARPMLYPAVVESLANYRPERVRELVAATDSVAAALEARLGDLVTRTPVAVRLEGEDILEEAMRRGRIAEPPIVPVEATAALAMLLLRDHGILTVHFAALPPGTAALLVKFIPPETLDRFGGADAFATAVDSSLDALGRLVQIPSGVADLLVGEAAEHAF